MMDAAATSMAPAVGRRGAGERGATPPDVPVTWDEGLLHPTGLERDIMWHTAVQTPGSLFSLLCETRPKAKPVQAVTMQLLQRN